MLPGVVVHSRAASLTPTLLLSFRARPATPLVPGQRGVNASPAPSTRWRPRRLARRPRLPARRSRSLHRRRRRRPDAGRQLFSPIRDPERRVRVGPLPWVQERTDDRARTERKYESAEPPDAERSRAGCRGGAAPAAPTRSDLSATYRDTEDSACCARGSRCDAGSGATHARSSGRADAARPPPVPGDRRRADRGACGQGSARHRRSRCRRGGRAHPAAGGPPARWSRTRTEACPGSPTTGSPPTPSARGPRVARPWTPSPSSGPRSRSSWPGRAPRRCSTGSRMRCCAPGCTGRSRPRSWAGCSPSGSRPARRDRRESGRDRGRGRARLRDRAGRDDPRHGSAGPPRRPGGGARHARGLPADAQHLPSSRAARPQPYRRPRRGTALARG